MNSGQLPRILIIDDLFGREAAGAPNRERENLCGKFLLEEEPTGDQRRAGRVSVPSPVARAHFYRGQTPVGSGVGAVVQNDLQGALAKVHEGWTEPLATGRLPWSLVLLDLCFYTGLVTEESHRRNAGMPEGRPADDDPRSYFGLTLLDAITLQFPDLPVMIFSSKPREEVSLEFSRRGALGFIARDDLRGPELLEDAIWQHGLLPDTEGSVVGNSLPLLLALREARRASRHRSNILIRGERGSGKELFAGYLHRVSKIAGDAARPFVTVNSAMLTTNLSSELFGIEAKTATGVEAKIGLIETADGGDLFLDEIADMPLDVQAGILRVLQERQITRIGSREPRTVDVRFLSATNVELDTGHSNFRADLLDRLRLGGTVRLPPLRERPMDIAALTAGFVAEAEAAQGARTRDITPEALQVLTRYRWPGNVRELRACLFDAVSRHPDVEHLVPRHLRLIANERRQDAAQHSRRLQPVSPAEKSHDVDLELIIDMQSRFRFHQQDISQWSGRLAELQLSHNWLAARYLKAALSATKRHTPKHPEGVIQIHPAVKLITGDPTISASKAADVVKRLLSPIESELKDDLLDAYLTAVRLRPKSARRAE